MSVALTGLSISKDPEKITYKHLKASQTLSIHEPFEEQPFFEIIKKTVKPLKILNLFSFLLICLQILKHMSSQGLKCHLCGFVASERSQFSRHIYQAHMHDKRFHSKN